MKHKLTQSDKQILIFGAGKIGRSFIGQVFGRNGYKVVFSDVDQDIIKLLNERGSYSVEFKSEKTESFLISNVSALNGIDKEAVINALADSSIAATSVGKNALTHIIPLIAQGLQKRFAKYGLHPIDIILAENLVNASTYMYKNLQDYLPAGFPLKQMAGLVETSIGKMVPIMPEYVRNNDPLLIYAEPYNSLIVDRKAFSQPVPDIPQLAPKNNIHAWVERKAFIHNLGHAAVAYTGYYRNPGATFIWQALEDDFTYDFSRKVMLESATALLKKYPMEFSLHDLEDHIDDLLSRFKNKHLADTIYRVGMDLPRKLSPDDRFLGAVAMAKESGLPYQKILTAYVYGLFFKAIDENGDRFSLDINFSKKLENDFEKTIEEVSGISKHIQPEIFQFMKERYAKLKSDRSNSIQAFT